MLSNEFKINEVGICAYIKNTNKCYAIICLYMDDMLILGNNDHMIKSIMKMLTNIFDMKDLGITKVILRIQLF